MVTAASTVITVTLGAAANAALDRVPCLLRVAQARQFKRLAMETSQNDKHQAFIDFAEHIIEDFTKRQETEPVRFLYMKCTYTVLQVMYSLISVILSSLLSALLTRGYLGQRLGMSGGESSCNSGAGAAG
ncbi:unnamed protein product [Amoebophrya sp. A25]|nr:unnamed protein product [Amoebophrya sp. A25]|eukprot:GSA25T00019025001.1